MTDEWVLAQADALVEKGRAIELRPQGEQYSFGGEPRLQPGPYAEWRSQSLAFLRSVLPEDHTYVSEFTRETALVQPNNPEVPQRDGGVGVLGAVRADLAGGYLVQLRRLLSGEVFTDFLGMATHLLSEGYRHPAASLAGAVLEDSLRRTLGARGVKSTGNLESMNKLALDSGLYSGVIFTQVKVWIAIRNDADHGNFDRVEHSSVESMVRDLPAFLIRLGLA